MNKFLNSKLKLMPIIGVIIVAVLTRLIPHIPNVTPIAAIALFSGANINNKKLAFVIPLVVMFVSDIIIGFHAMMLSVYISFILTVGIGMWLRSHKKFQNILLASVGSSLLFYLLTNFNYWSDGSLYPKTMAGLIQAYIMALPFLRNTMVGDLFYSMVLFYGYAFVVNPNYKAQMSNQI